MGILREFEVVEPFIYLRGDLVRLGCAYVFMEVLARGSGAKTEPSFRLALRFLRDLKAAARPLDLSICFFYRLMALLGYRPSLERCIRCTANERLMGFEIARGGALCEQCLRLRAEGATQLDSGTIKVLQRCLAMPLGSLASLRLSPRQAELLLPLFLAMVGHYLESEIKSARFLHQVLNSTEPRRKKQ